MKDLLAAFILGVVLAAVANIADLHIRVCFGPADSCQQHWSTP